MAVGSIVLLIVIFSAGWVVTSSSAKAEAKEMAENAVIERLAPISVAQFMKDPNREEHLRELKKLDSWKGADYVKEHGWSTMPGEKEPDRGVADACARRACGSRKVRTLGHHQECRARNQPCDG